MPRGDPIPAIDRVRARPDTSAGPFGCWPYQGAVNKKDGNGYGVVTVWTDGKQRVEYVHRVVLAGAPHAENMRDALRRGRLLSGDRCPWTKISATDRALIARSSLTGVALAREFGVSSATISRIRSQARKANGRDAV